MKKMKRRGFAKVEFLACKEQIYALRDAGYTIAMIYDELKAKNKITMSYQQLCMYIRGKKSAL